jgi:hypothetical protein
MALYLILHHRRDPLQTWANSWLGSSESLIEAITTTKQIADLCSECIATGKIIYIHRCGYSSEIPTICCSAIIDSVNEIGSSHMVKFKNASRLHETPRITPNKHQNYYNI